MASFNIKVNSGFKGRKKSLGYLYRQTEDEFVPVKSNGKRFDYLILIIVLLLSMFGLLMIFDASQFEAFEQFGNKYYFIKQQLVWMLLGFVSLGIFSIINYHLLAKIAWPLFIASVLLLFMVFIPGLGVSAGGAHRWLKISSLTIQPAEIIKLSSIIFFSSLLQKKHKNLIFLFFLTLVITVIGVLQKDLGTAIVYSLIAAAIYFISGAPVKYFAGLFSAGFLGFIIFTISSTYRRQRILAFMNPFSDPQGFSYHIAQILIALGSGGLLGLGVGQSRQKFAYIPEVTTDSIFSVIGEEFGFLGSLILIGLVGFLIYRCFKVTENAPDMFGKLLSIGLTSWLGFQAVINLASMVSLIPLTGVPLPFISYGGSALLANLVAVGILINISRQSYTSTKH